MFHRGFSKKNLIFENSTISSAKHLKMFYRIYGNHSGRQSFSLTVSVQHFSESPGPQLSPDMWNFDAALKITCLELFFVRCSNKINGSTTHYITKWSTYVASIIKWLFVGHFSCSLWHFISTCPADFKYLKTIHLVVHARTHLSLLGTEEF